MHYYSKQVIMKFLICVVALICNTTIGYSQNISSETSQFGMKWVYSKAFPKKKYHIYDADDKGFIYKKNVNATNCFFILSKKEFRLYVYEATNGDTALVAHFPVCFAKNTGDKHKTGDGTTPVCAKNAKGDFIPFTISQIVSSKSWKHDFHDGRGNILAYGDWFMRLKLNRHPYVASNTSIGIHGSSGNSLSVPGRDSEGCIRLRNEDLNQLRSFAQVGTKVIIKPENTGKLPFEVKAELKLGNSYKSARKGYILPDYAVYSE